MRNMYAQRAECSTDGTVAVGQSEAERNCLEDGIDVQGYYAWSAFDNYEWALGYRPTFGLIAVDRTTQTRTVKPSGHWLGEVARTNQLPE